MEYAAIPTGSVMIIHWDFLLLTAQVSATSADQLPTPDLVNTISVILKTFKSEGRTTAYFLNLFLSNKDN